ncbi:MAG: hypothetical protein ACRDRW_15215 [Pseudonocardiaceae bacterium]
MTVAAGGVAPGEDESLVGMVDNAAHLLDQLGAAAPTPGRSVAWRGARRAAVGFLTDAGHAQHAELRSTLHRVSPRVPDPRFGTIKTPAGPQSRCSQTRPPGGQPDPRMTAERAHPGRTPR